MGFSDKLKSGYFFFEDKWYSGLDKINPKVPVYKVVDPVDRVIPSFILFLLIILFIIVLMGYLIQFANPYEVTITAHDSSTKILLSGVALDGEINGDEFSGNSDSTGEYSFIVQGASKNFYGMFFELFAPSTPDFGGYISAEKDGYTKISRETVDFTSTKHSIYLEALPVTPDFPSSTVVILKDSTTSENIVSSDSYGYVKFKCNNKNISVKTVRDDTDGTKDGKYTLSEDQCQFVVTKSFSTGYKADSIQKILPTTKNEHILELDKVSVPTTGTARVYVYDINSPDTNRKYIPGIKVFFNSTSGSPQYVWTDVGGVGEKVLPAGTYTITIADQNYYEITSSDNITIDIEVKNEPTQLSIGLEKLILSDKRQIYFKVNDATDGNVISGVKVDLLWLNKDLNGNYFGTDGNLPLTYNSGTIVPSQTDSNGLFKTTNVTVRKDGELVAILKKENYVYEIFKPTFFEIGSGPQTVTMELATATNSGKAHITVKAGDNNRPLLNSAAYLYDDIKIGSTTIKGVAFERNGILTNSTGLAEYINLPIGPSHVYSAEAKFGGVNSGISSKKSLDANQTIFFNIHMDLDISFFEIELYNLETKTKISNVANASVKLFVVNDDSFTNKTLSENISYNLGKFISNGYDRRSRIAVSVDLNGYSPQIFTRDGIENQFGVGNNKLIFYLLPLSMIDGNVDIFFENIYSSTDTVASGTSTVLQIDPSQKYKLRFLAAINGQDDFTKLLALERTLGKVTISNIDGMLIDLEEQNAFACETSAQDELASPHDDDYYFPTGTACNATTGVRPQSGFNWSKTNLPKGTYSFTVEMEVDSDANFGDKIKIQYRAKEAHDTNFESESDLKEVEFEVLKPLINGIHFIISIEGAPVIFNSTADISEQIRITPNAENDISIRVYNNTNQSFSGAKLSIYSYDGETTLFDPAIAGTGLVHFNDRNGPKSKVVNDNLSVGAFGSHTDHEDADPEKFNSSNWIVVDLEEGTNTYVRFIDAKAWGKTLTLDAEFIAGIMGQTFDGTAYPRLGDGTVNLTEVSVTPGRDCKNTVPTLEPLITVPQDGLLGKRFEVLVEGVYEYKVDCVYVSANANDQSGSFSFTPIENKMIMATSGSGRDPALACVDITDLQGETDDTSIEWGEERLITVRNNCAKDVKVHLETGLICENTNAKNCIEDAITLDVGTSTTYTLTGQNADYASGYPDFKDTIGLFPVNVKAKFVGLTGRSRWVLADKINAHLTKENSCFSLSKDSFDFIESSGADIDFKMNSYCQYNDSDEFFFPKAILNAFGFEIGADNILPLTAESFDAELIVTGKTYETYTEDVNVLNYLSSSLSFYAKDLPTVTGPTYTHYNDVRFDLNNVEIDDLIGQIYWAATKFQFQFYDKNPLLEGHDAQPYGAAIDGNIIINYTDGTTASIAPRMNFQLGPPIDCTGVPADPERCELALSGLDTGDPELDVGLFYVLIPKGKVDSIDINFIGGDISNNLLLRVSPYLEYTKRETFLRENSSGAESNQTISLGTYSIYPIEGAEFYIKHINDLNNFEDAVFTGLINPRMYLSSTNSKVLTWIEQGYLKAKYVGDNISAYDDKEIELSMEKTFGGGINYSIVNVQDFVDPLVAYSAGKEISGVR